MSLTADHRSDIELQTDSDTIKHPLDNAGAGLWGWQLCDFGTLTDMMKQHYTNTSSTDFADWSP
jgi:hypothetical protein